MAGHSHSKNVAVRKGKQDAKRAKIFTKVARGIIAACKAGMPDPDHNPALRAAIRKALAENITRDKIQETIKRASGAGNAENYDEMRYEGYGPGGVAVIVEALTDNRNRTASDIRAAFTKFGGNLGETGSVNFMFDRVGQIAYPLAKASEDVMLNAAIEAGADNCETGETEHVISASPDSFGTVRAALEKQLGEPASSKIIWIPKSTTAVNDEQAESLLKMIDVLEDNDDVQEVFANYEISDEVLERLTA
jgi:YebC/PmpR family DNA-binding regulatory protein